MQVKQNKAFLLFWPIFVIFDDFSRFCSVFSAVASPRSVYIVKVPITRVSGTISPLVGTHFEPRFRGSVRMRGPEDTKSGKDNGPWRVSTNSALAVEKENRQNRWKVGF